jgi:hypothetical protein
MGWLIAIASYLLLLTLVCLFLRGGSLREIPQPQSAAIDTLLLKQVQCDSAVVLESECHDEWAGETYTYPRPRQRYRIPIQRSCHPQKS